MLSVSSGHSAEYLYGQVAQGRESYYLDAATDGEPPGRWWGSGAEAFGLTGEVDADDMKAIFAEFADPRDPRWQDAATRSECARLGQRPGKYRTTEEIFGERVTEEFGLTQEQVTQIRRDADAQDQRPSEDAFMETLVAASGGLPERLKVMRQEAERATRQPVAFIDLTFSPAKSVTVLHTAYARMELDAQRAGDVDASEKWAAKRVAVEEAIWEGNKAMLRHMTEQAGYSQLGRHGAGADRWIDSHDWTVASFFQHTSRELDPQLHIHNAVLNRVVCADGKVRTLDSRGVYRHKQGAGTIGEKVMEEALTRSLGVTWQMRADGVGREVNGVDQEAMDLFSERKTNIGRKLAKKVDEFREHFDREPNALELDRLRRQSSMATRKAKTHGGETKAEQLDRWDAKLREELVGGLQRVAETVGGAPIADYLGTKWSPSGVMAEAVAACQQTRAAFSRSELVRQVLLALPDNLGGLRAEQIAALAEGLADQALADSEMVVPVSGKQPTAEVPDDLRVQDGRSSYATPSGPRYATRAHVVAEQALRRAAVERGATAVSEADVDRWLKTSEAAGGLGEDQAAAVRGLLTSGAKVSVLVGPAGTGKSWTVGCATKAWGDLTGGRVFGLATSQIATEVLADDGVTAMNTTQWLGLQERLADGSASIKDQAWALNERDVVVVDEASMVDTVDMENIRAYAASRGARLVLTGDPRQLSSVGAGGAMAMLADGVAETYTLAEVRRFEAEWERTASLRLREGDTSVLAEYDRRGRILDCGTLDAASSSAVRGYVGDMLSGRRSLVVVPTNQAASRVSATVRDQLVQLGRVSAEGVMLGRDGGNLAGVGDLVTARRNDWRRGVVNRRRYVVRDVHEDGSLTVDLEDGTGSRTLPADYVEEHLVLGYAGTVHSVQGVTVDTCHGVDDGTMSPEALYVAMTRAKQNNTMHVATIKEVPDEETGVAHERERRSAVGVLEDAFGREQDQEKAALVQDAEAARDARSMHTIHARVEDAMRTLSRTRTDGWLDRLAAEGVISEEQRLAFAGDQATEQLSRQLRVVEQAGVDPEAALRSALEGRSLDGARSVAQVVHHRVVSAFQPGELVPQPETATAVPADVPQQWRDYLAELAELADDRRRELGTEVAQEQPQWAVEAFGPVPSDPVERMDWEHHAGVVASYREVDSFTDEATPLRAAPGTSSTEKRAAWHGAWTALGRPEAGHEEQDLGEGALRVRVKAWRREQTWAPQFVDAEMKATGQQAAKHRQDAALLQAQAEATADRIERERLLVEAEEKAVMADMLADVEQGLEVAAEARAAWLLEVSPTREAAERAQAELAGRGRDIGGEDDRVTADEWLALHEESMAAEDPHRVVTEADVLDEEMAADTEQAEREEPVAEEVAEVEPDMPRGVPTPAETAAAVAAARVAMAEMADRRSAEAAHAEVEAARVAEDARRVQRERELEDAIVPGVDVTY